MFCKALDQIEAQQGCCGRDNKEYDFVFGSGAIHVDAKFDQRDLKTDRYMTAILLPPFSLVGERSSQHSSGGQEWKSVGKSVTNTSSSDSEVTMIAVSQAPML